MKKSILLIMLLVFYLETFAQVEKAKEIIEILSSDSLAGRGYVENGQAKAAIYISKYLQEQGVSSMHQELQYPVNTFNSTIQLIAHTQQKSTDLKAGKDFLLHPASGSIQFKEKELVQLPSTSTELEEHTIKSKKVYSINKTEANSAAINKMVEEFISTNSFKKSLLIIENNGKLTWSPAPTQSKNAVVYLTNSLEASAISAKWKSDFKKEFSSSNIIAKIPGQKSDSAYMFSGHYDHLGELGESAIFRGANDNASGVAMLLTLSAYFADNTPQYDTYLLFTTGEELGLLGSRHFIENPLFDLRKIKMLINLDMVGTGDEGITVVNAVKHPTFFQYLTENNQSRITAIKSRGEACNSDHCFFDQIGVPAVFIYTLGGKQAYHDINDNGEGLSLVAFNALHDLLTEYIESEK